MLFEVINKKSPATAELFQSSTYGLFYNVNRKFVISAA
jgi:hypothetical protein